MVKCSQVVLDTLKFMWIKKSPEELIRESRQRVLGLGAGVVCVAFLLFVFGFPHAAFNAPLIARVAALAAAAIILLAWGRRAYWRRAHESVWICERCNVVRAYKDQPNCACGGNLTPLCQMKWVEMPPLTDQPPAGPDASKMPRAAHAA
jgi:hypothetical protein